MSEVARYRKKPLVVQAMRLTADNVAEVAKWSHARSASPGGLHLRTLEGTMIAALGDYVVCGTHGEFYPCRSDIFQANYELVED